MMLLAAFFYTFIATDVLSCSSFSGHVFYRCFLHIKLPSGHIQQRFTIQSTVSKLMVNSFYYDMYTIGMVLFSFTRFSPGCIAGKARERLV